MQGFGFAKSNFLRFSISTSTDITTRLFILIGTKFNFINDSSMSLTAIQRVSSLAPPFCSQFLMHFVHLFLNSRIMWLIFFAVSWQCFHICHKFGAPSHSFQRLRRRHCLDQKFASFHVPERSHNHQRFAELRPLRPQSHFNFSGHQLHSCLQIVGNRCQWMRL